MMTSSRAAVHPFPARMAPELAAAKLASIEAQSIVLDPMMGSGTFPVAAAKSGHRSFGCDTDPLALVIASTLAASYDLCELIDVAHDVARKANLSPDATLSFDPETSKFIDFWFDPATRGRLTALAVGIKEAPVQLQAPLWCAFSRLIITKDAGASRARDVSHSRPHRVRDEASFDPIEKFVLSAQAVANRVKVSRSDEDLRDDGRSGAPSVMRADARCLPFSAATFDAVMTSPPYLIAIDYLRGHRLSLVWMGYSISYLRDLRSGNIGSEMGLEVDARLGEIVSVVSSASLPQRSQKIVARYVRDLDMVMSEIVRVVKPGGLVSFVTADARMNGIDVSIEKILLRLGDRHHLSREARTSRALPESRRYLPPPRNLSGALDGRMKQEVILTFSRR